MIKFLLHTFTWWNNYTFGTLFALRAHETGRGRACQKGLRV